jgi:hypothetical protein
MDAEFDIQQLEIVDLTTDLPTQWTRAARGVQTCRKCKHIQPRASFMAPRPLADITNRAHIARVLKVHLRCNNCREVSSRYDAKRQIEKTRTKRRINDHQYVIVTADWATVKDRIYFQ